MAPVTAQPRVNCAARRHWLFVRGHEKGLFREFCGAGYAGCRMMRLPVEQGEAGAAVHLAFDGLDLVDDALDPARAVWEGEPVEDGFLRSEEHTSELQS